MEYKYAPKYLQEEFTLDNILKALDEGFNVNSYYEFWNKKTFLMQAVIRGKKNIVAYLLENGADVNMTDMGGDTALSYYRYRLGKDTFTNLEEIVHMLLEAGALFFADYKGEMMNVRSEREYKVWLKQQDYDIENMIISQTKKSSSYLPDDFWQIDEVTGQYLDYNAWEHKKKLERWYPDEIGLFGKHMKEIDDADIAWRASVGLPPSERLPERELYSRTRAAKNIYELIMIYYNKNVMEILLGTISASSQNYGKFTIDKRITVAQLKKQISLVLKINFKFDLVYLGFHLQGKKTLEDERDISDYGLRNGSKIILSPIRETTVSKSGKRGGRRTRMRRGNKRVGNKTRVSKR